ncbi:MAG: hypothetical protein FJX75_02270 [Armatimonadetes bacterium]|nr:hypothetical protein [Armatimonadota bacterium]
MDQPSWDDSGGSPPPKSAFLRHLLGPVLGVGLVAGLLLAVWLYARQVAQQVYCYPNLGAIGLATRMYCADHNGRFPLARNWCDAVEPEYVKNLDCFRCPALPHAPSGYAYNAGLEGLDEGRVGARPNLVMACDGLGGWNASGGPELFDPRHRWRMGLVVYVDGRRESRRRDDPAQMTWKP